MFATVMATIVVSTVMCALIVLDLGLFRLGNLVRFIPHPVIGGVVVTMGWLLGPFANANLFTYVSSEMVVEVDWSLVISALPDIASLILLCVLGLLLSATALEVAMRGDIDLNHELKLAGIANSLAAPSGGIAGSHSLLKSRGKRDTGRLACRPTDGGGACPPLESRHVLQGEYLIRQGDPSSDLFFIESGRVAIQLENHSGPPLRLRSMCAGTVVGEIAMYLELPRSTSAVAEQPSRVYRLTRYALEQMRINDSALSAKFNEFMVRLLAGRLLDTNNMLRAVMD